MLRLLKSSGGAGRCCSMADAPNARCACKGDENAWGKEKVDAHLNDNTYLASGHKNAVA